MAELTFPCGVHACFCPCCPFPDGPPGTLEISFTFQGYYNEEFGGACSKYSVAVGGTLYLDPTADECPTYRWTEDGADPIEVVPSVESGCCTPDPSILGFNITVRCDCDSEDGCSGFTVAIVGTTDTCHGYTPTGGGGGTARLVRDCCDPFALSLDEQINGGNGTTVASSRVSNLTVTP